MSEILKQAIENGEILIINMQEFYHQCCICGIHCPSKWGIPVDAENGLVVSNDFEGDWLGNSACQKCHDKHATGAFVGEWPSY